MSVDGEDTRWMCGTSGMVCLHRVSSIVREIAEPCLNHSPAKGVDPSIRAEVWEFLLGCYTFNSTTENRKQLRMTRREWYKDLVKQCQMMHSSIGTGNLAFVVGSKVMDVRTLSKDNSDKQLEATSENNSGTSTELVSARISTDNAAYN